MTETEKRAPFGGLDREELNRRSAEGKERKRRERAEQLEMERAAAEMESAYNRELADVKIAANPGKESIGPLAAALATRELLSLLRGDYPIQNATQALKVVEVATAIARLEAGEPTSITGTSAEEKREIAKRLKELSKARAATQAEGT